jgi:hypothetical protein
MGRRAQPGRRPSRHTGPAGERDGEPSRGVGLAGTLAQTGNGAERPSRVVGLAGTLAQPGNGVERPSRAGDRTGPAGLGCLGLAGEEG